MLRRPVWYSKLKNKTKKGATLFNKIQNKDVHISMVTASDRSLRQGFFDLGKYSTLNSSIESGIVCSPSRWSKIALLKCPIN